MKKKWIAVGVVILTPWLFGVWVTFDPIWAFHIPFDRAVSGLMALFLGFMTWTFPGWED